MLTRKAFYSTQHVSLEDLEELVQNNIEIIKDLLSDWQPETASCILTTSNPSSGGNELLVEGQDSLVLNVNSGTAYWLYDKLKLDSDTSFSLVSGTDINGNTISMPTGLGGSSITRKDIIGIRYVENKTSPKNVDFIDSNKNIYKKIVYTEVSFGGELVYIQGNRSDITPVDPSVPSTVMPLARIYLRDDTTSIISSGEGTTGEGYVEDLRSGYLFNKKYD